MGKGKNQEVLNAKRQLTKYIISRIGHAPGFAFSYERVCKALETDGRFKPANMGSRTWVKKNLPYILEEACTSSAARSAEFLQSYEWRKLRMQALKKYGAKCMCCGATPATGAVMNVDHIKPRKLFPSMALDINNLQILCHECNHGKGNWDQTDWRTHETLV
jgi:5-methylcytosine-specific restriction endonuclease McrA